MSKTLKKQLKQDIDSVWSEGFYTMANRLQAVLDYIIKLEAKTEPFSFVIKKESGSFIVPDNIINYFMWGSFVTGKDKIFTVGNEASIFYKKDSCIISYPGGTCTICRIFNEE